MNMIGNFDGFMLVETDHITKQVQSRTHKKKRINKKWLKKYGFKEVPDYEKILVVNKTIFAQPRTIKNIIAHVDVHF